MSDFTDDMWADESDFEETLVTCDRCGVHPLVWVETSNGWRLASFDDGSLHVCDRQKMARAEFDPV